MQSPEVRMSKPREFSFKVWKTPVGFDVVWSKASTEQMEQGDYHVIEYSAYEEAAEGLTVSYVAGFERGKDSVSEERDRYKAALEKIKESLEIMKKTLERMDINARD